MKILGVPEIFLNDFIFFKEKIRNLTNYKKNHS